MKEQTLSSGVTLCETLLASKTIFFSTHNLGSELECSLVSHSVPVAESLHQLIRVDWPPLRVSLESVEHLLRTLKSGWVVASTVFCLDAIWRGFLYSSCCCLSFRFCIPLQIKPQAGALPLLALPVASSVFLLFTSSLYLWSFTKPTFFLSSCSLFSWLSVFFRPLSLSLTNYLPFCC